MDVLNIILPIDEEADVSTLNGDWLDSVDKSGMDRGTSLDGSKLSKGIPLEVVLAPSSLGPGLPPGPFDFLSTIQTMYQNLGFRVEKYHTIVKSIGLQYYEINQLWYKSNTLWNHIK